MSEQAFFKTLQERIISASKTLGLTTTRERERPLVDQETDRRVNLIPVKPLLIQKLITREEATQLVNLYNSTFETKYGLDDLIK